jgi:hypothetical protein
MLVSKARCELCGGELVGARTARSAEMRAASPAVRVLDDLAAAQWVQAYDAAWLGRDWSVLERCFAPEVAVMLAGFSTSIAGRAAVLAHMRAMLNGTQVHEYNATDLKGYSCGTIGVITYRWQFDRTVDGERRATSGRDILVLQAAREGWQLVWRAQVRS